MLSTVNQDVAEFLRESNKIESVYDLDSFLEACDAWDYVGGQEEMTVEVVLRTHQILMRNQPLEDRYKGVFRDCRVWVGSRECLDHRIVRGAVNDWCLSVMQRPALWRQHHVRYESIHPFVDGNGRTGRIFLNWERLRAGLPILIIKESEKHEYYRWFDSL